MPNSQFSIPLNYFPIGIAGAARSGKDTLCSALIRQFSFINIKAIRKSIAGDSIKRDLNNLLMDKFSIDSFTSNSQEKEFIRPFLVEYGKLQIAKTQGRYFIESIEVYSEHFVSIIPDIRYMEYPKDEVYWLKNEINGILIFIERVGMPDANETERKNNIIIKNEADYILKWDTLDVNHPDDLIKIDNYAKWIIDQYYIPMLYSATTCQ